jgi:hypothetical protein
MNLKFRSPNRMNVKSEPYTILYPFWINTSTSEINNYKQVKNPYE